jgi:hypothetical protein
MRTTLSLDDDVARMLERLKKSKEISFKQLVNDALREGLTRMTQPAPATKPFRTQAVDLGRCSFPSLDNVWEVIAEAEGEWHK